jgi:hypothetical protein
VPAEYVPYRKTGEFRYGRLEGLFIPEVGHGDVGATGSEETGGFQSAAVETESHDDDSSS